MYHEDESDLLNGELKTFTKDEIKKLVDNMNQDQEIEETLETDKEQNKETNSKEDKANSK